MRKYILWEFPITITKISITRREIWKMGKSRAGQPVGKQKKMLNDLKRYLREALEADDEEAEYIFQTANDILESYHIRDKSMIDEIRKQREYKN